MRGSKKRLIEYSMGRDRENEVEALSMRCRGDLNKMAERLPLIAGT